MPSPDVVVHLLTSYGYLLVFPLAIVEGPIVSIIAGFLTAEGYVYGPLIYVLLVLGDLCGDGIAYAAGRWGRRVFGTRVGSFTGRKEYVKRASTYLSKNPGRTLLFAKLTHSAGFIVLVTAGAVRVPLRTFFWYNLLGTVPKSLVLLLVGYLVGSQYRTIDSYITKIGFGVFVLIAFFVGWFIWKHVPPEIPED